MITIDGKKYKVTENMGFNHSIGKYCKMVDDNEKERVAVRIGKSWRFWTADDRIGVIKTELT